MIKYDDDFGKYYKTRKLLEINLLDGTVCEVGKLLETQILFWSNQLVNFGLIPSMPTNLPELLPKFARRSDSRFNEPISLFGFVGEEMEQHQKILVYSKVKRDFVIPKRRKHFRKAGVPVIAEIIESPFSDD